MARHAARMFYKLSCILMVLQIKKTKKFADINVAMLRPYPFWNTKRYRYVVYTSHCKVRTGTRRFGKYDSHARSEKHWSPEFYYNEDT